jgi:hypothetical protein
MGDLLCEIGIEGFIIFSYVYGLIVHAYICGMFFFIKKIYNHVYGSSGMFPSQL